MSEPKTYKVLVRQVRTWTVYVSAGDAELAEEHACDIPEDELGEPDVDDVDAEVQHLRAPDEPIPEGTATFPRGLK